MRAVYIAGKISQDIAANGYLSCYQKFRNIEIELSRKYPDAKIYNPMNICKSHWSWLRCMMVCFSVIIFSTKELYFLPDWEESKGAKAEHWLARMTKKKIHYK